MHDFVTFGMFITIIILPVVFAHRASSDRRKIQLPRTATDRRVAHS